MRMRSFARRNNMEILRDPVNLFFGAGFPVALLLILRAIDSHIPVDLFGIGSLAPGIAVFGLSFMALFSATLVSKDRASSFLQRLYATPMTARDFILGYLLPMLPVALGQSAVLFAVSALLGLEVTVHVLSCVLFAVPVAALYVGLGLLCGSVFTDRQVGGICGALLTNLTAWLSGVWFDLKLVGGAFERIADLLPFVHAVEMERAALRGDYAVAFRHSWWVTAYAAAVTAAAIFAFLRRMDGKR